MSTAEQTPRFETIEISLCDPCAFLIGNGESGDEDGGEALALDQVVHLGADVLHVSVTDYDEGYAPRFECGACGGEWEGPHWDGVILRPVDGQPCGCGPCQGRSDDRVLTDDEHTNAVRSYLGTALWSSIDWDDDERPLDEDHDEDDISPELRGQAEHDVTAFAIAAGAGDVRAYVNHWHGDNGGAGMLGHDLWLTRNHHGAGFWDRGLPGGLGDRLTAHAHDMGEVNLYVGADGLIYGE